MIYGVMTRRRTLITDTIDDERTLILSGCRRSIARRLRAYREHPTRDGRENLFGYISAMCTANVLSNTQYDILIYYVLNRI